MLQPYIGCKYEDAGGPRLLLVGESHYLPKESTQHRTPESWYSGNSSTLNKEEIGWISTSKIIEGSRSNAFRMRSHSIWKNSFKVINENGPHYPDFRQVADDIAFFNFFQRPASFKLSLCVEKPDLEAAKDHWDRNYDKLTPAYVVFLSKLAYTWWQNMKLRGQAQVVPHPGCVWWSRKSKKYGNLSGHDMLASITKDIKCTRWAQMGTL